MSISDFINKIICKDVQLILWLPVEIRNKIRLMINKINCLISLEITLKTEEEKQDFKERFKN